MASIFSRHAFRAFQRAPATRLSRPIHTTAPVFKKKKVVDASDDLFGDDFFDAEPVKNEAEASESVQSEGSSSTEKASHAKRMEPEERERVYKEWLNHVKERVGRHPEVDQTPRKRIFNILMSLATTKEQAAEVVDVIPKSVANKRELPESFAEVFTRRCQQLQCPELALKVFGNYPVYQVKLTLPAARWLLHSLYVQHPFSEVLLAANLYPAYELTPINKDLVSASLLAAACYKHKTPECLEIAEALRPDIASMLEKTDLSQAPNQVVAREKKWAAWALRRVNNARAAADEPFVPMQKLPLRVKLPPRAAPKAQTA